MKDTTYIYNSWGGERQGKWTEGGPQDPHGTTVHNKVLLKRGNEERENWDHQGGVWACWCRGFEGVPSGPTCSAYCSCNTHSEIGNVNFLFVSFYLLGFLFFILFIFIYFFIFIFNFALFYLCYSICFILFHFSLLLL